MHALTLFLLLLLTACSSTQVIDTQDQVVEQSETDRLVLAASGVPSFNLVGHSVQDLGEFCQQDWVIPAVRVPDGMQHFECLAPSQEMLTSIMVTIYEDTVLAVGVILQYSSQMEMAFDSQLLYLAYTSGTEALCQLALETPNEVLFQCEDDLWMDLFVRSGSYDDGTQVFQILWTFMSDPDRLLELNEDLMYLNSDITASLW